MVAEKRSSDSTQGARSLSEEGTHKMGHCILCGKDDLEVFVTMDGGFCETCRSTSFFRGFYAGCYGD